jgi:glycosyltransferase involved in cell wall biosynthesis
VSVANIKASPEGAIASWTGTRAAEHRPLRIVSVFNRYALRGGEEEVFETEVEMLASRGCAVTPVSIRTVPPEGILAKAALGLHATWSAEWYTRFTDLLAKERPDVVHVHNSFPVMSPAIYHACQAAGVPVVQTLHNYRLVCPGSLFYRDGRVCEDCLKGGLHQGVLHGCYRNSRVQTAAVALMLGAHRAAGTWNERIDRYIALTEFARKKFIEGGLPGDRIAVKSNFLQVDPGLRQGSGKGAIFVGLLSEQKGILTLLDAWRRIRGDFPLRIIGEGPLLEEVRARKKEWALEGVSIEGRLSRTETISAIRQSQFLIFPSLWYECFPLTLIESFACGVPVISSQLGAMAEIVEEGRTGIFFRAGDDEDLSEKIEWARSHHEEMKAMSGVCRHEFLTKYTADQNFDQLMRIYDAAMLRKKAAIA